MSKKFLTLIDLTQNEIQNAILQNLGSAPSAPKTGQVYFSSSLACALIWNGSAWISADASKLSTVIPMTALTIDPTQRANHTGTQAASTISNLAAVVQAYPLSTFTAPAGNVAMAGYTFTGLPAPTGAGQPAEYSWVVAQIQSAAAGISSKDPVAAVATSNVATSGLQTIDGVALAAGQRVLLAAQTTASQNGPWVVQSGAWTRPTLEGSTAELDLGALWLSTGGTVNAGTQWRLATTGTITPGTTSVSIVQFGAAAVYSAGGGMALTGASFSVSLGTGSGLTTGSGSLAIDTTVVARKYSATIGDGSSTAYTVNHNLGTRDVVVQVYQTASPYGTVEVDHNRTDTNNISIVFAAAPAAGAYRVVVTG